MAIGEYDHLNADNPINATVDMDELAKRVVLLNYGAHRFLSALVRALREASKWKYRENNELADEIEKLLNAGLH
jgi:hypothetical protein